NWTKIAGKREEIGNGFKADLAQPTQHDAGASLILIALNTGLSGDEKYIAIGRAGLARRHAWEQSGARSDSGQLSLGLGCKRIERVLFGCCLGQGRFIPEAFGFVRSGL